MPFFFTILILLSMNMRDRSSHILIYDPAIPLLGIYLKHAQSYPKDTCPTMFIAVLFIIARTWTQPRCPSAEEWIKKMWYIYTMEY